MDNSKSLNPLHITQQICAGFLHPSSLVSHDKSKDIADFAMIVIEATDHLPSANTTPDRVQMATALMLHHIALKSTQLLVRGENTFPQHSEKIRDLFAPDNTKAFGLYAAIARNIVMQPAGITQVPTLAVDDVIGRANLELAVSASGLILPVRPPQTGGNLGALKR